MADEPKPEDLDITDELIAERRGGGAMPSDMPGWMAKTITGIDAFSLWTGRIVCVLILPLCAAMVYEVIARYAFIAPTMWAYDMSRFIYGALFMLGAAYALSKGVHIRADFIYRNWPVKRQGAVDMFLYIVFYFPGMLAFLYTAGDFAFASMIRNERGMDTAWMPVMWPVKSTLPLGVLFLIVQGVSELLKSYYAATRGRWP